MQSFKVINLLILKETHKVYGTSEETDTEKLMNLATVKQQMKGPKYDHRLTCPTVSMYYGSTA